MCLPPPSPSGKFQGQLGRQANLLRCVVPTLYIRSVRSMAVTISSGHCEGGLPAGHGRDFVGFPIQNPPLLALTGSWLIEFPCFVDAKSLSETHNQGPYARTST